MDEGHKNFVEAMLKSAEKKEEAKPMTRTDGVDRNEIKEITEGIIGFKKKSKEAPSLFQSPSLFEPLTRKV